MLRHFYFSRAAFSLTLGGTQLSQTLVLMMSDLPLVILLPLFLSVVQGMSIGDDAQVRYGRAQNCTVLMLYFSFYYRVDSSQFKPQDMDCCYMEPSSSRCCLSFTSQGDGTSTLECRCYQEVTCGTQQNLVTTTVSAATSATTTEAISTPTTFSPSTDGHNILTDTTSSPSTTMPTSSPSITMPTSSPPTTMPTSLPSTTMPTSSPPTTMSTSSPPTTMPTSSPPTTMPTSSPSTTMPTSSPPTSMPTSSPPTSMPTSSPPTTMPTSSPPTTMPTSSPPTTMPTSSPPTTMPTSSPPITMTTTTAAFRSVCSWRSVLYGGDVDNSCPYSGVARIVSNTDNRVLCNAVYARVIVNGTEKDTFLTTKTCKELIVEADLKYGDRPLPIVSPLFNLIDAPDGIAFIDINERYIDLLTPGCQNPACGLNYLINGSIDGDDCKIVRYGNSDTAGNQTGPSEVKLVLRPFGCGDIPALNSENSEWCFFTSSPSENNVYCTADSGAPVYCRAKANGEYILIGTAATQQGCNPLLRVKAIALPH